MNVSVNRFIMQQKKQTQYYKWQGESLLHVNKSPINMQLQSLPIWSDVSNNGACRVNRLYEDNNLILRNLL